MSKGWDSITDFLAPLVPDAPENLMQQMVKFAAIRLCERSGIFKEELFIDSQAGVPDYPLELDSCWVPHTIYALCVNGMEYNAQQLDACCNATCNRSYVLHDPRVVNIRPTPRKDEIDGIRILLSVKPHVDSCDIPDMLYDDWSEVIVAGAAARLMKMPRKPWSAPGLAKEYEREFSFGVNRAMIRAYKGFTRDSGRLRARPFVSPDKRGVFISGVR